MEREALYVHTTNCPHCSQCILSADVFCPTCQKLIRGKFSRISANLLRIVGVLALAALGFLGMQVVFFPFMLVCMALLFGLPVRGHSTTTALYWLTTVPIFVLVCLRYALQIPIAPFDDLQLILLAWALALSLQWVFEVCTTREGRWLSATMVTLMYAGIGCVAWWHLYAQELVLLSGVVCIAVADCYLVGIAVWTAATCTIQKPEPLIQNVWRIESIRLLAMPGLDCNHMIRPFIVTCVTAVNTVVRMINSMTAGVNALFRIEAAVANSVWQAIVILGRRLIKGIAALLRRLWVFVPFAVHIIAKRFIPILCVFLSAHVLLRFTGQSLQYLESGNVAALKQMAISLLATYAAMAVAVAFALSRSAPTMSRADLRPAVLSWWNALGCTNRTSQHILGSVLLSLMFAEWPLIGVSYLLERLEISAFQGVAINTNVFKIGPVILVLTGGIFGIMAIVGTFSRFRRKSPATP